MSGRIPLIVLALGATAGLFFASYSTFDFVQHLDRQVHDIHCSFVPGLVEQSEGAEGCQVTMMSPYSSLLRTTVWGGIPIALGAMSVFAFIMYRAFDLIVRPAAEVPPAANFLLATSLIPVAASAVMGYIAYAELQAACKLCIGIYASSAVVFLATVVARRRALKAFVASGQGRIPGAMLWMGGVAQAGVFVALPVLGYVAIAPDNSGYIGACGTLTQPDDPYGMMVPLDDGQSGADVIEVFDPLCPACRAFEERLEASGIDRKLSRRAVMFPLDAECNWMVASSMHPGACAVSEGVLCAAEDASVEATEVIEWAFANQEEIIAATKADAAAAAQMVSTEFPSLESCVGSAEARQKLNKALRWTVANELPVLTPQLYVDGVKLCDEDTDLGLDWALTRMLKARESGELAKLMPPPAEPAPKAERARPRSAAAAAKTPAALPAAAPEDAKADAAEADPAPPDEPVKPEPVKPEPVKPEPVKPEPVKPEPKKAEPNEPKPVPSGADGEPPPAAEKQPTPGGDDQ